MSCERYCFTASIRIQFAVSDSVVRVQVSSLARLDHVNVVRYYTAWLELHTVDAVTTTGTAVKALGAPKALDVSVTSAGTRLA